MLGQLFKAFLLKKKKKSKLEEEFLSCGFNDWVGYTHTTECINTAEVSVCLGHSGHKALGFVYVFFLSPPPQVTWVPVMCWIKLSLLAKLSTLMKCWLHKADAVQSFLCAVAGEVRLEKPPCVFSWRCAGDGWLDGSPSLLHQLNTAVLAQSPDRGLCVAADPI